MGFCLIMSSAALFADEIEQHNGTKIIGTVTKQTDTHVFVENKYGLFKVERKKIKRMQINKRPGILDLNVKESRPKDFQFKAEDIAVIGSVGIPFGKLFQ